MGMTNEKYMQQGNEIEIGLSLHQFLNFVLCNCFVNLY
jgi:hypothetical protein